MPISPSNHFGTATLYYVGAGLPYPFTITGGSPVEDFIFSDGFESGDLSAWSSAVTDLGDLAASTQAKYWGAYGLAAQIDDTNELYVQDDSPDGETRYHARFYLDPNGLAMGLNEELEVFSGQAASGAALRVQLMFDGSEYHVRIGAATDAAGWVDGAWHSLDPGRNAIEIEWLASTAAGANNGLMRLWLNGAYFDAVYQVDNDTLALDSVRLGAVGVDAGTSGTLYLEEFESRRLSHIGTLPDPGHRRPRATQRAWLGGEHLRV